MNYYEVSSAGDKRFSALYARLEDGRSVEEHYQCNIKGYRSWREGKGKPPLRPMSMENSFEAYVALWRRYLNLNPKLLIELRKICANATLRDRFAKGPINQASALEFIVHEQPRLL